MKLKPLVAAALLATSAGAFAADNDLGTLGSQPALFNGSGTGFVFDTWSFTVSELSNFRVDLTFLDFQPTWGFANIGVALLDSSLNTLASAMGTDGLSYSGLGAGTYALAVTGFAGNTTGVYTGIAAAAPVPEPETYALMLAGLGIVGFIASRRRNNSV